MSLHVAVVVQAISLACEWTEMLGRAGIFGAVAVLLRGPDSCGLTRPVEPFEARYTETQAAHPVTRPSPPLPQGRVLQLDFESFETGQLDVDRLRAMVPAVGSAVVPARTQIVAEPGGNHTLVAHFPVGAVGPQQGGVTFIVALPQADEYRLSYRVRASPGFDFARGGKLPGLCSGGGRYTGGVIPTEGDGWSARFTWGATGSLSLYAYHVGMTGPWGVTMGTTGRIVPGQWHVVTQHVRVNREGYADGRIAAWVDGVLVFERGDLELRRGAVGRIDSICFSNFHGGSGPEFAPSTASAMTFDDVIVTEGAAADHP